MPSTHMPVPVFFFLREFSPKTEIWHSDASLASLGLILLLLKIRPTPCSFGQQSSMCIFPYCSLPGGRLLEGTHLHLAVILLSFPDNLAPKEIGNTKTALVDNNLRPLPSNEDHFSNTAHFPMNKLSTFRSPCRAGADNIAHLGRFGAVDADS